MGPWNKSVNVRPQRDPRGVAIVVALCALPGLARAQTLTTLYSFSDTQGSGTTQGPLIQGPAGLFYGATQTGGTHDDGRIFKVAAAGALTALYSFSGADGMYPSGGLTLGPDGNFYGTTYVGETGAAAGYAYSQGSNGQGTIFRITPTGTFTVLHYFDGLDGGGPFAGLTLTPNGNLYGATTGGGTHGEGAVFEVTLNGTLTSLYSFGDGANAPFPYGPASPLTLGPDGNLYGTTQAGNNGDGAIFKITPAGALTTLYSFKSSGSRGRPGCSWRREPRLVLSVDSRRRFRGHM